METDQNYLIYNLFYYTDLYNTFFKSPFSSITFWAQFHLHAFHTHILGFIMSPLSYTVWFKCLGAARH